MAEYLVASGSRKISALTSVTELSGSTSMPIVMGGNTVQISHSNFLTNNLLSKSNTFTGNNTFNGQTTIQNASVTDNLVVGGRVSATSLTGSLSFNNLTDRPTLVSGSSQINYSGISNIPSGIVSGSSQISYPNLSNIPNGIISSSAQIDALFNIDGLVSGSSQISFNGITDKPTLVSSSQQIRNYGIFATTGSNTFIGNQLVTGSVGVSGSVNADSFTLGSPTNNVENTAYWLKGNPTVVAGNIGFNFSSGNTINNIQNLIINEVSSDINGTAGSSSLSWFNGLVSGSVIVMQGVTPSPSNLNQTITLSVNSILDNGSYWTIGVDVLDYQPVSPLTSTYEVYSFTYITSIGDGAEYSITSDATKLLISSSNTQFSGDVNITGSLEVTQTISTQIVLTPQVLTGQLVVPSGFNGILTGPVSNGGELTIEGGSNLAII